MKITLNKISIASLVFAMLALGLWYSPVSAQGAATSSAGSKTQQRMERLTTRANQEIDRRINGLNRLMSRIESMRRLSDSDKSALKATVQAQVEELNSLKSKVGTDTDLNSLLADAQSITKSYRIYALVIPQGAIMASADRVLSIADTMDTLASKLQARISQEQSAGKDVAALQSLLSDFNAKVSDARTQAQNATSEISGLKPDQGDTATLQSNQAALKNARTKIHAAQQDFVTARKDAGQIVRDLKAMNGGAATGTPVSTSSSQ